MFRSIHVGWLHSLGSLYDMAGGRGAASSGRGINSASSASGNFIFPARQSDCFLSFFEAIPSDLNDQPRWYAGEMSARQGMLEARRKDGQRVNHDKRPLE